jgi:ABC-type transport system involved in cytochrome c biogenesis ATPase subunit
VALLRDMLGAHLTQGGMAIVATHQDIDLAGRALRRLSLS